MCRVADCGGGAGLDARQRLSVSVALRRHLVEPAHQESQTAGVGDPAQYLQHGHARPLHTVLFARDLRGPLQRGPGARRQPQVTSCPASTVESSLCEIVGFINLLGC